MTRRRVIRTAPVAGAAAPLSAAAARDEVGSEHVQAQRAAATEANRSDFPQRAEGGAADATHLQDAWAAFLKQYEGVSRDKAFLESSLHSVRASVEALESARVADREEAERARAEVQAELRAVHDQLAAARLERDASAQEALNALAALREAGRGEAEARREQAAAEAALAESRAELDRAEARSQSAEAERERAAAATLALQAALDDQLSNQAAEREIQRRSNEGLQAALEDAVQREGAVRAELAALTREHEQALQDAKSLQDEQWALKSRLAQQAARQDDLERELQDLSAAVHERDARIADLQQAVDDAQRAVSDALLVSEESAHRLDAAVEAWTSAEAEREALAGRLSALQDERDELRIGMRDLDLQLRLSEDALLAKDADNVEIRATLAVAQEDFERLSRSTAEERAQMEVDLAASSDERSRLTTQLRAMSHSWAHAETERDALLTRAELAAVQVDNVRREFNTLSLKLRAARVEARRRANGVVPETSRTADAPADEQGIEQPGSDETAAVETVDEGWSEGDD